MHRVTSSAGDACQNLLYDLNLDQPLWTCTKRTPAAGMRRCAAAAAPRDGPAPPSPRSDPAASAPSAPAPGIDGRPTRSGRAAAPGTARRRAETAGSGAPCTPVTQAIRLAVEWLWEKCGHCLHRSVCTLEMPNPDANSAVVIAEKATSGRPSDSDPDFVAQQHGRTCCVLGAFWRCSPSDQRSCADA